jgi:DNA-nicking Smr family endonuclease
MFSINNDDKKIWKKYIENIDNYHLKINGLNKEDINQDPLKEIKTRETKNYNKLLGRGLLKIDAIKDFHGYNLNIAKDVLINFILNSYKSNLKNILVITGKGKNNSGILKKEVPRWLYDKEIKKYIISHFSAPKNLGGEGAILIRIKTKKIT